MGKQVENSTGAFVSGPRWTVKFWRRLGFYASFDERLFDWRMDVPKGGDMIHCMTDVTLSWGDRLRVLVSGKCSVTTWTKTKVEIGPTETRSQFAVMP